MAAERIRWGGLVFGLPLASAKDSCFLNDDWVVDQAARTPLDDQQARFRQLYAEALPLVYGYLVLRVGGNRAVAEDLTADTFAAAVRHYRAGRSDEVTPAWLQTVARRRLVDHWRRRAVASERIVVLPDRQPRSEESGVEERQLVVAALADLDESQRAVLVLHHVEGYPVADVAQIVGRTVKGTESLLSRARKAFRAVYGERTK